MPTLASSEPSRTPAERFLQHATLTVTTEELPHVGTTFHAELRTTDGTVLEETPTGWWAASVNGGPEDVLAALRAAGWTLAQAGAAGPLTLHAVHRPQATAHQPDTSRDRATARPVEKRMMHRTSPVTTPGAQGTPAKGAIAGTKAGIAGRRAPVKAATPIKGKS